MSRNFDSIGQFRKEATDDDIKEILDYINEQQNRTAAFPCCQYNFSYSAISQELIRRGLLKPMRHRAPLPKVEDVLSHPRGIPEMKIDGEKYDGKWVTRSFVVKKDLLDQIDALSERYWMYSKKAIFNEVLKAGLDYYKGEEL